MATAMVERYPTAKETRGKGGKEAVKRFRNAQRTAMLLKQASDPTRLQILQNLRKAS